MSGYFYRGRHRQPTDTGRNLAVGAATAALALPGGTAFAAEPAPAGPPGGWGPIISCESGGDPSAENPSSTASGLFQFLDSTWRSVGGSGSASDASVAEQYRRAERLYASRGTQPWNASRSCWAGKVGAAERSAPPARKAERRAAAKPRTKAQAKAHTHPRRATASVGARWTAAPADLHRRDAQGRGTYTCDTARLGYDACDPDTLGQVVAYPLFDKS